MKYNLVMIMYNTIKKQRIFIPAPNNEISMTFGHKEGWNLSFSRHSEHIHFVQCKLCEESSRFLPEFISSFHSGQALSKKSIVQTPS